MINIIRIGDEGYLYDEWIGIGLINRSLNLKTSVMQPGLICQSCTMPINKVEDRGTEKTGAKSELYCKYCYKDGVFTNPKMTLKQMMILCEQQMKKQNISPEILAQSFKMLPQLKRWNNTKDDLK